MILVDLKDVAASRPQKQLFEDLSVTVRSGDRLGIVGINGCGKSTLMRVIACIDEPEAGAVTTAPGIKVAILEQVPNLQGATVSDAAGATWESDAVLDRLGMGPHAGSGLDELSGGQMKRVALAATLTAESDLMILDEPTNHLDIDAIAWLEEHLAAYRGALVMVTHDRHVLDRVTNRILELDRGDCFFHEGEYGAYLEGKALREEQAVKSEAVRKNLAKTELAWLRRGAPPRTSKSKARIRTATELVGSGPQKAARSADLPLHMGTPRLGDQVVDLEGVGHRYPDGEWLFRNVDLLIDRHERLGIVGPNGAGKSTLLEIIAGNIEAAEGTLRWGSTAKVGYYDQVGRQLDPTTRVRDAVTGPEREADYHDKALMEAFWFNDDSQWSPVSMLSGGERRRLQLLMVLAEQPNVLLLDEPTNDLDLETLRLMEDFLDDWPGALIVVSHDRALLERTIDDVIVVDGTGFAGRVPGGYEAYENARRSQRRRKGSVSRTETTPNNKGLAAESPASKDTASNDAATKPAKARSASTIKHEFRGVEKLRSRLEAEQTELTTSLEAGPDHEEATKIGQRLATLTDELDEVEEAWLALAAEAEERGIEL